MVELVYEENIRMALELDRLKRQTQEEAYSKAPTRLAIHGTTDPGATFKETVSVVDLNKPAQYNRAFANIYGFSDDLNVEHFLIGHKGEDIRVRPFDLGRVIHDMFGFVHEIEQKTGEPVSLKGLDYFLKFRTPQGKELDLGIGPVYHTKGVTDHDIGGVFALIKHAEIRDNITRDQNAAFDFLNR